MASRNGTKTHCPRGTLRGTAPTGDNGRCRCELCKQYKKDRSGLGARTRDPVLQNRKKILGHARARARKNQLPFDITLEDIVIPDVCPVLGIKLTQGKRRPTFASPTLDRKIPSLGYVKGNVSVMSHRANSVKSDASPEELMRVALWARGP